MAGRIVTLKGPFAREAVMAWEEQIYQEGCVAMREQARQYLAALDEALLRHKPAGWRVVGHGERTVMTRFGPMCAATALS